MVDPAEVQGEAVATFPGPEDVYQISVYAIAEDDGRPTIELWIGEQLVATFTYPLGSSAREPVTLQGPTVFLTTGMKIRLVGNKDRSSAGSAHARVDEVHFTDTNQTVPSDEPPPGVTFVKLEAEEMILSGGYQIDPANPDWIMVDPAEEGEAVDFFPGPDGEYQLTVAAIAEDDGQSELELWVGGELQAVFTYPLGSSAREPVTLQGPTVFLTTGMKIRLRGIKDFMDDGGAAHARVDVLLFDLK